MNGQLSNGQLSITDPLPAMGTETPIARHTDPEESHVAAAKVDKLTERQEAVLNVIAKIGPATDVDIAEVYEASGMSALLAQGPSGLRTRRKELVDQGRVVRHDTVKPGGRQMARWRATTREEQTDGGS